MLDTIFFMVWSRKKLPTMMISCLIKGMTYRSNLSFCAYCILFKVSMDDLTKCLSVLHHCGMSTGSISSHSSPPSASALGCG